MSGGAVRRSRPLPPPGGDSRTTQDTATPSIGFARGLVHRHPVAAFFVLAYALAWAWWIPLALAHHGWFTLPWTTHIPGLVAPLIAAFVVTGWTEGGAGLRALAGRMVRWRIGARWAVVTLSPLLVFAAVAGVMALAGSGPSVAAMGRFDELGDLGAPGLLFVLIAVNGFGEETGWRGYAHHHLNTGADPRRAVAIVAALWAGWHLPLFAFHQGFRDLPVYALPGWLVGIAAGAVLLAWLYERSGRSILAVAVWHGAYNFAVASDAGDGAIAAVITALVIAAALVLTRCGDFSPGRPPPV